MNSWREFVRQIYEIYLSILELLIRTFFLFIIDWCLEKNKLLFPFLLLLFLGLSSSTLRSLSSYFAYGSLLLIARFLSHYYVSHSNDEFLNLSHIFKLSKFKEFNSAYSRTAAEQNDQYPDEGYLKIISVLVGDAVFAKLISFLAIHVLIVAIVNCLLEGPSKFYFYKKQIALYLIPVIARYFDVSDVYLEIIKLISSSCIFLSLYRISLYRLPNLLEQIKSYYTQLIWRAESNGILSFIQYIISNFITSNYAHLLVFWIIALGLNSLKYYEHNQLRQTATNNSDWCLNLLIVLSSTVNSPVSLLAFSVSISYLSAFVLFLVKVYLHSTPFASPTDRQSTVNGQQSSGSEENRNEAQRQNAICNHTGWEEGLTTLLLSVFTGITELKPAARMAVLTIILFCVLSSLMLSCLDMTQKFLALSPIHQGKYHHIKILLFLGFLIIFPLYTAALLAQVFSPAILFAIILSTTLLVSFSAFELAICHCLLWFDSTRGEPWEPLDQVIYICRGIVKIVEFTIVVFVVMVGLSFNRYGFSFISASVILINCYSIFKKLIEFHHFIRQRKLVCRSDSLPNATKEELEKLNDVCSICLANFQPTSSTTSSSSSRSGFAAKVLRCPAKHIIHTACLRLLLLRNEKCPLCCANIFGSS